MTSEVLSSKAIILLASRLETVEVAVRRMRPETLSVIVSQEILEAVVTKCLDLRDEGMRFLYHLIDSPTGNPLVATGLLREAPEARVGAEHARLRGL